MEMRKNGSIPNNVDRYSDKRNTHVNFYKHVMLSRNYGPIWTGLTCILTPFITCYSVILFHSCPCLC